MGQAAVLLPPGAADWEFAAVLPVLRYYLGLEIRTATPDGRGIETIGGVRIEPDVSFDTVDWSDADIVILIGSDAWIPVSDPILENRIAARIAAGKAVAGICAGTLPLARAGVLNDRPHTSNALGFLSENAAGYSGSSRYRDVAHAVSDGLVATAPGTAPASFAAAAAAAVAPDKAAEIVAFWSMTRGEFEALGTDLTPIFKG